MHFCCPTWKLTKTSSLIISECILAAIQADLEVDPTWREDTIEPRMQTKNGDVNISTLFLQGFFSVFAFLKFSS